MRPARVALVLLGLSACAESPVVATVDAASIDVVTADQPIALDVARDASPVLDDAASSDDRVTPSDVGLDTPPARPLHPRRP